MRRFKAVVIGGSGYGGAELIRRLLIHPDVELVRVASVDHVGEPLGAVHLPLTGRTNLRFEDLSPGAAVAGCDVALLGLPHRVSARKVPEIFAAAPQVKVVDMSGDFRLKDAAAYERFYGGAHPHPELLGRFVYGLPELNRDAIRGAQAVASPGCFATTIELALLPLARAGRLGGVVQVVGITGSSGSGVAPSLGTHHPIRAVNLKTYKVLEHQHTPEIGETLAQAGRARPGAAVRAGVGAAVARDPGDQLRRGAGQRDHRIDRRALRAAPTRASRSCASCATACPRWPRSRAATTPRSASRSARRTAASRTLAVVSATDNLIKGGAGQAIQNMNLMLGLPETASLEDPGPWP